MTIMSKENEQFLALYKTYEGLLRQRGTDYRAVEEAQVAQGSGRMTIMRQMRNYLSHEEDPGFLVISPVCISTLEKMIKEEQMNGDIVKNHLVTPAKGSLKEGTQLSEAIYRMAKAGVKAMPVYDDKVKRLKGLLTLEKAAYIMNSKGNLPISTDTCGSYGMSLMFVKPDKPTEDALKMPEGMYICCTKDGTLDSQYLGYLDR